MPNRKKILAIIGSASTDSANLKLVKQLAVLSKDKFGLVIFNELSQLPHFNPELSVADTPQPVLDIRQQIADSDGIIICTPEYVFSIPGGLKNLVEWCVSTTVFSHKPAGLITASASGVKGHEELQLIMRTIEAKFTIETTLLIQGIKGKIDENGELKDNITLNLLEKFIDNFENLING